LHRIRIHLTSAALCLLAAVAGCERATAPAPVPGLPPPGPVATVEQRLRELHRSDLAGYARHSVPPALYAELDRAWREDRSRWPLTELPLDDRLPGLLSALGAPDAERKLRASYRREFADAHSELRSAATTLGLLGVRHLKAEPGYSADERAHYIALVEALSDWGRQAPLGATDRANPAITRLAAAARRTGLHRAPAWQQAGMAGSLQRLGPFFGTLKQVLADYGLDFDRALDDARVELVEHKGDRARVKLRYELAERPIEVRLELQRIDGRWYLADVLTHARTEAARGPH
jgi:hypothetical protein